MFIVITTNAVNTEVVLSFLKVPWGFLTSSLFSLSSPLRASIIALRGSSLRKPLAPRVFWRKTGLLKYILEQLTAKSAILFCIMCSQITCHVMWSNIFDIPSTIQLLSSGWCSGSSCSQGLVGFLGSYHRSGRPNNKTYSTVVEFITTGGFVAGLSERISSRCSKNGDFCPGVLLPERGHSSLYRR